MPLDSLPHNPVEGFSDTSTTGVCGAWSVVQTNPQAERWAADNLSRAGYPTYLPLLTVRRRDPVTRSISRPYVVPLFAGYLFVVAGSHWGPVSYVRGVHKHILSCGRPAILPYGFVEGLRSTEGSRGRDAGGAHGLKRGAAVRIVGGAFAGRDAVVLAAADDAVRVGVMMFGHVHDVEFRAEDVEAR